MRLARLAFAPRFAVYTSSLVLTAALLLIVLAVPSSAYVAGVPLALFGALALLGTRDLIQTRHAVLRNYPITAHLRFLLEEIRPEMRQYFFESEKDGAPFSRDQRAVVYQRAKMVLDKRPFGTQHDVYAEGFEWIRHSMQPQPLAKIGKLCKERNVLFHTDAAQAAGKVPLDVEEMGIDLLSLSGHKIYGPKGIGALYVRRRSPHVRLEPQIDGGGHERGLRSGTLPVPLVVGLGKACSLCREEMPQEAERLLQQASVPAHHVLNATTARTDTHVAERAMFVGTTYADREVLVTSSGYHFSSASARVGRVPRIGEDSASVLRDVLGYAIERVEALVAQGVVSTVSAAAKGA